MNPAGRRVLWWGRFDPDYSRNRVLRQAYRELGWTLIDFHPRVSALGDLEAALRRPAPADLVHVPCFRQRDVLAAARFARRHRLPLLFDPLISAFDKQLFERRKLAPGSWLAQRLLRREQRQFAVADRVLADTAEHARFFADALRVERDKLHVVYVGAEESLFTPAPQQHTPNDPLELLFYGSFIPLQGPQVIVEAARLYRGPAVRWTLLGNGPLKAECRRRAAGLANVAFADWLPYEELPARIRRADILLGVFGDTPKAQRVIPNKVFQSLACGMPLVTEAAPAYPAALKAQRDSGIHWVAAGDSAGLAAKVAMLAAAPTGLHADGLRARRSFDEFFSQRAIVDQLRAALAGLTPEHM